MRPVPPAGGTGPAEDCGGVHAHELIEAAADPGNPDHADAVLDLAAMYGDVGISSMARTAFSLDAINGALLAWDAVGTDAAPASSGLPGPLGELVSDMRTASERRLLLSLIDAAGLDSRCSSMRLPRSGWSGRIPGFLTASDPTASG